MKKPPISLMGVVSVKLRVEDTRVVGLATFTLKVAVCIFNANVPFDSDFCYLNKV